MSKLYREVALDTPFVAVIPRHAGEEADILCMRENIHTKERAPFKQYRDSEGKLAWTRVPSEQIPRDADLIIHIGPVNLPGPWELTAGGCGHSF